MWTQAAFLNKINKVGDVEEKQDRSQDRSLRDPQSTTEVLELWPLYRTCCVRCSRSRTMQRMPQEVSKGRMSVWWSTVSKAERNLYYSYDIAALHSALMIFNWTWKVSCLLDMKLWTCFHRIMLMHLGLASSENQSFGVLGKYGCILLWT